MIILYRKNQERRHNWEGVPERNQRMHWTTCQEQSLHVEPDICRDRIVWILWTGNILSKVHRVSLQTEALGLRTDIPLQLCRDRTGHISGRIPHH